MVALVLVEPQRVGERAEQLGGGLGAARLFEAHQIVGGHAGQLRRLLAPQPGRAAARPGGQPDILRPEPLPGAADEVSELASVHGTHRGSRRRA
ncbi:hypothetical protein L3i22_024640 [Actinoplanes sp. L3-i22]|nr:hypothetical protein L3i22_024640 [Actinoplanes sp. L3-i22]